MPDPTLPTELRTALQVVTMPRDANKYGTIFGGVILSYIDQAGFIEVRRYGSHRWVTVALESVEFHEPVHVGDIVAFLTSTEHMGTKSVRVRVVVKAERFTAGETVTVTEAHITMVAVDENGQPIPFRGPPTVTAETTFGARP